MRVGGSLPLVTYRYNARLGRRIPTGGRRPGYQRDAVAEKSTVVGGAFACTAVGWLTSRTMTDEALSREPAGSAAPENRAARDIADVPALEVVSTAALHLMSAAAVQLGLAEDLAEHRDLAEARTLIDALAGLVTAAAPHVGDHHAAPLRDGVRTLSWPSAKRRTIPTHRARARVNSSPVRCRKPWGVRRRLITGRGRELIRRLVRSRHWIT